ncbi:hypothetical protein [Flavobacterium sp.]|uniref:hypothetical protein n=1 Tax=Flavobacterium sp. TaxID=239 RepID=UPI00286E07A0|nr:hypothetical protein [Flavobacterium sp.]
MKNLKFTIAFVFVLFLTCLDASSQTLAPKKEDLKNLVEMLSLTDVQQPKFYELTDKYQEKWEVLMESKANKKERVAKENELQEAKDAEMKFLLNTEQFEMYSKLTKEQIQKRKNRKES